MTGEIDLAALSARYGRRFTGIELVVGGVNRTYRISDGETDFYLRLYRLSGRSEDDIAFEIQLLESFPPLLDVSVARPVSTSYGPPAFLLEIGGERRHACLFHSVDGRELVISREDMAIFGAGLAKLHAALPTSSIPHQRVIAPMSVCDEAIEVLQSFRLGEPLAQIIEADCRPFLEAVDRLNLPRGICHGDAWAANVRISDEKLAFFDFDDCGVGPLMIDLGAQAWHLHHDDDGNASALMGSFISGYDAVRTLDDEERDALPAFVALAEIRSLLFLAKYCALTNEMWQEIAARAPRVLLSLRKS